jgi:hypothetical protein
MSSTDVVSPRVLVRHPTLISLDLPLTAIIGIAGKGKQILTYTQDIANLERLRSARLIHEDQTITTRHARVLNKTKEPTSLL